MARNTNPELLEKLKARPLIIHKVKTINPEIRHFSYQIEFLNEVIAIKVDDNRTRDKQIKKRYTYKVMKKVFMSFSHEFGT